MVTPLDLVSLRSVTCPRFAKQFYTEIGDKTSAGKKTLSHNIKRKGRLTGYS